jgi:hypothetical protein
MKTIPLKEAYQILEDCSAIITDDHVVTFPCLSDLEESDENEFLYIGWVGEHGEEYSVKFEEGNNQEIKVSGTSMFLVDNEGDECQITILTPKHLE